MHTLRTTLPVLALTFLLPLSAITAPALFNASSAQAHADDSIPAPDKRSKASDFTLKDLKGKRVKLSDFAGKPVVISLWATWCKPCMQELGFLQEYYAKHEKDGLVILAIATDGPETTSKIRSTAKRKKWTMPVLHDSSGTVTSMLNPRGTNPFTVFVDRQGRLVKSHEGFTPGDEKSHYAVIQKLLKEK